jgi:hypothetical protein
VDLALLRAGPTGATLCTAVRPVASKLSRDSSFS